MNIGDKLMEFKNRNIGKVLAALFVLSIVLFACKKDGGAYEYVNKLNVYEGDVYQYLKSQSQFDSLTKVIDRTPGLKEWMAEQANLTVFALTNRSFDLAFTSLNKVRSDQSKPKMYIETANQDQLGVMLDRYIIARKLTTDSLKFADGAFIKTAQLGYEMNAVDKSSNASGLVNGGPKSIIFSDTKNSQYIKDWISTTTQAENIHTKNAVVHIVGASHEFDFGEFTLGLNQ